MPFLIRLYNYYQLYQTVRAVYRDYNKWRNPGYRVNYKKRKFYRRRRKY